MNIQRLLIAVALIFGIAFSVQAQEKQPADSTKVAKRDAAKTQKRETSKKDTPKKTIADLTKSSRKYPGLFTVYEDTTTGALQLQIRESQIGKEYIYFTHTVNAPVSAGTYRGNYRGSSVLSIQKHFDKIEIISENTAYYFDPKNALSRAAEANISPSILISEKIAARNDSTGNILIKADGIFLTEALHRVNRTQNRNNFSLGRLSKTKTKCLSIKNYPKNTDFTIAYTYENPNPKGGGDGITDARNVTITLQHTLIEMPKNDYQPRFDDPRVGYFNTQVTDLTSKSATPYRDLIHRWHIKKRDPKAKRSEPVVPITYWIENTTPHELRPTIKKAALAWNIAFEAAGFKNAVQIKEQPDDADWEAGDIRYNVLRWTSSPNPPFGGYGPSFVNPRTGQILGADIMLEFAFLTRSLRYDKLFDNAIPNADSDMPQYCSLGHELHASNLFGTQVLRVSGASKIEVDALLKDSVYYLILHEIGHTLGLNHNMKSSQLHTPAQLHDKSRTGKMGLTGSVMDYPGVNLALPGQKQGHYYTTRPGPYDIWAIEFGYSPGRDNIKDEQKRLEKILARSTEPELMFGNDADDMRSSNRGIDPRVMIYDLSSDAIAHAMGRIELTNDVKNKILAKYNTPGNTYHELKTAYLILTAQHRNAAIVLSRYIGGIYVERAVIDQPGATRPFTPVTLADQKRAMDALAKYVLSPKAFDMPPELYNHLQEQRRGFGFSRAPEDPKIHDRVIGIQQRVFSHLLHPTVQARLLDTALYGNEYALSDMMTDLTDAVFAADAEGTVNSFRQNLQAEYVNRLIDITDPENKRIYASRAVALHNLQAIQNMLKTKKTTDASTEAHTGYILHLIEQALDKR